MKVRIFTTTRARIPNSHTNPPWTSSSMKPSGKAIANSANTLAAGCSIAEQAAGCAELRCEREAGEFESVSHRINESMSFRRAGQKNRSNHREGAEFTDSLTHSLTDLSGLRLRAAEAQ